MLIRQPDLEFVEIAEYACPTAGGHDRGRPDTGPAAGPEEAEIDDLHMLPRGDPEC